MPARHRRREIGDLPRVTGDRSQLRSVLQKLIHNAATFNRPRPATSRKIPGFGIGLATSRCIVEAHGGSSGVEPRLGGGSVFWLVLREGTTD